MNPIDLSTYDDRVSAAVSGSLNGLLRFDRSMVTSLDALEPDDAAQPVIVMLRAYLYLLGGVRPPVEVVAALRDIDRGAITALESAHLDAIRQLLRGDFGAAGTTLLEISRQFPADELALAAGHQVDFLTGATETLLARLSASPLLTEGATEAYPYLLAMLAFALGENHRFAEAHAAGRRALELAPDDNPWAVHACAHALFETRDHGAVADLLSATRARWNAESCLLRTHLSWHHALNSMAGSDHDALVGLTGEVTGVLGAECSAMQFCDAVSLLWRLRLAGRAGPDDFTAVADKAPEIRAASNSAFVDLHVLLAIIGADRHELAEQLANEIGAEATDTAAHLIGTRRTAVGVAESFRYYCQSNPEQAVRRLISVLPAVVGVGGSMVQRDLALELLVTCDYGRNADLTMPAGIDKRPLVTNLRL
ncbi:hypothetical protein NBRGN_060_01380 [Nocardia brasiliensis NBRC 14402]|uniref:hypothetical protein n=1 Tax=Nocardia brasiliensis TaxID=37326 RepID=UPI00031C244F|nr:hypothetical protein [Nocardia brasiliensis]ASF07803.1 hypothetical protein CEQ30_10990 [Nocardia brasiliensis]GAJ83069.1 hypothetical protein NBRGN_060_01380 [Nocardia brasiliensis NBRC 14402]SUB54614.1 Uncharacterised protein [Nocardia brasiliensis]